MKSKTTGTVIAATAAALFMAAPMLVASSGTAQADSVKCVGGNSCKGHSACKTASSSCKGQNACKGQGFTMTDDKASCEAAGGKVES
ncbi:MAG: hypothetical protein KDE22_05755 [Rhodobacterales bacterium]|nr:hypothetical protein [Rhodobacterales bacterium]